ncbi:MFS transporter [Streptosporangium roseum]|uniref:MFS transporter n=1 Tax=Streptosporangium roseum TaxID=2001 RepID=UPI00331B0E59
MTPMASALRLPRALVFATLCLVVSGGGHVLAGGAPIPAPLAVLGALIAFCLAYALNGRERGLESVLPATVATQVLLHELFSRATPVPHTTPLADHGHPGPGMTVIHLVVALLTGWWLHRGESALWLMIRLCGARMPVIRLLLVTAIGTAPPAWQAAPASDVRPYGGWDVSPTLRRRGPPLPQGAG